MNRSVADTTRELLVVSQFTLYGDTSGGRRPSWIDGRPPGPGRAARGRRGRRAAGSRGDGGHRPLPDGHARRAGQRRPRHAPARGRLTTPGAAGAARRARPAPARPGKCTSGEPDGAHSGCTWAGCAGVARRLSRRASTSPSTSTTTAPAMTGRLAEAGVDGPPVPQRDGPDPHGLLADAGPVEHVAVRGDEGGEAGRGDLGHPAAVLQRPQARRRDLLGLEDRPRVAGPVGRVEQQRRRRGRRRRAPARRRRPPTRSSRRARSPEGRSSTAGRGPGEGVPGHEVGRRAECVEEARAAGSTRRRAPAAPCRSGS